MYHVIKITEKLVFESVIQRDSLPHQTQKETRRTRGLGKHIGNTIISLSFFCSGARLSLKNMKQLRNSTDHPNSEVFRGVKETFFSLEK